LVETEVRARTGRADRKQIAALAVALQRSRRERRRLLREADPARVLDVMPMWIGTLSEIDDILPAVPGMFDVVVFDEASQIDQVRAATALMRGRRAVIVGDPRQLRHVSFVSDERMDAAAAEFGVSSQLRHLADVRRNSLFDIAAATSPVIALREHFRSAPHIIGFSNRKFYSDRLRLMTQHPRSESRDAILTIPVAGKRLQNGSNPEEVVRAMELIAQSTGSVGVVTPFRAQAEAIEEAAIASFSAEEILRLGLKTGTAHAMQGSEYDTVIISVAIDDESLTSLRFVEDPNLFNTMVTRARRQQIVLRSFTDAALPRGLLADYLEHAVDPPRPEWSAALEAGWPGLLGDALREQGFRVVAEYPVAGWKVDLAVGAGGGAVGVICGVHADGPAKHIERQSALRRAGWEIVDAFESFYLANPDEAIEAVVGRLLNRRIG
jgi:superfamily I DNA and/or RNA helicase